MKIWKLSLHQECQCKQDVVACIGYFDGLHKGHQALVSKAIEESHRLGCESALITFDPDPWVTIKGVQEIKHITTMKQRQKIAERLGIDHFFVLDFESAMAKLSPEDFMAFIMERISLRGLVCGFDFHYGAMGKGNKATLQALAFDCFKFWCVESIDDEQGKISSSRISECIEEGNVKEAMTLLGYPYTLSGTIIHGNAQGGTKLGFPTANCEVEQEYIIPKRGVYIGKAIVKHACYPAMINIGHNPTFNKRHMISIEAHLLGFDKDIYGQEMELEFYEYIRKEQRFDSIDELIQQLQQDVALTASYFNYE